MALRSPARSRSGSRDGLALIIVLAFILLTSILIISFIAFSQSNRSSTVSYAKAIQAQEIAQGGIQDILSDFHQEIIAGSTVQNAGNTAFPSIFVPSTNLTAVPARIGYANSSYGLDASSTTLSPTLVRVSRATGNPNAVGGDAFFSSPNYSPAILNRASLASTAVASANARSISAARWNRSYLLATNFINIPSPFTNAPPDWVYVTRTGSRVCTTAELTAGSLLSSSNLSTNYGVITPGSNPPVSPVVGRYAFVIYDEGALLDANVVGVIASATNNFTVGVYPAYTNTAPVNYQTVNGKSYLSYADLTVIPGLIRTPNLGGASRQPIIDALVNWRNSGAITNAAAAGTGNSYLGAMFTSAQNGFLTSQSGDKPFIGRQDLINYFANMDQTNSTPPYSTALTYLGTFSREFSAPSYCPPADASTLGGANGTGSLYAYHANAETTGTANPDMANLRWPAAAAITHYSDTGASTNYNVNAGDPFLQNRFSLSKIGLLSQADPVAGTAPTSTAAIQSCFGLVWGVAGSTSTSHSNSVTANGGNPCWNYVGSPAGSGATAAPFNGKIETLDQVAAENREPNFFEILKAAILSGSIGLSPGPAAFSNGTASNGWGYDLHQAPVATDYQGPGGLFAYSFDGHSAGNPTVFAPATVKDIQIIQIGANIIDQYDTDSYPTAIYFPYSGVGAFDPVGGGSANPIYGSVDMVYGDENLPELNRMVYFFCSTAPAGNTNPTDDTDAYTAANGGTKTLSGWYQPELWNPHQQPAALPNVPKNFQIRAYGSVQLAWTWGSTTPFGYGKGSAQSETWLTDNSNLDTNTAATINFTDGSTTSSFYAHPYTLTSDSIPTFGSATVSFPVGATGDTTKNDPINIAQSNYPYYAANNNLNHFVAFWAGTTPATDPGSPSAFRPFWTQVSGQSQNASVVPTNSVGNLFCNTFILGWVDSSKNFHPYSFITGAFPSGYNTMYSNGLAGGETRNGSVNADSEAPTRWGYADPRTSRFSMYINYFSGQGGPLNNLTLFAKPFTSPSPNTHLRSECCLPNATGFNPINTPAGTPEDWAINQASPTVSTTGATSPYTYYSDPDGVVRPGDGVYANTVSGDGLMLFGSNGIPAVSPGASGDTGNVSHGRRPVILNRPFRSVGELGYVFRDLPFKTLDFFTQYSADAALLDVFSLTDEVHISTTSQINPAVAGRLDINNAPTAVIQAVLSGGAKKDFDPSYNLTTSDANSVAGLISTTLHPAAATQNPLLSRADLVTKLMLMNNGIPSKLNANDQRNKAYTEAPIRALADVVNTRTWNLMIDIIAQSGRMSPTAKSLSDFVVEGEKRYWLHIAIDRYTGKIVDQQLEAVYE